MAMRNPGGTPTVVTGGIFVAFLGYSQANFILVPTLIHDLIHYFLLTTMSFDTVQSDLLTASLHKPEINK
jgi:hypothetical protein